MSNNALNSFRKTFFLVLLFSFVLEKSNAIPTFIDKAVKEKMEVGQTKSFCPTSLVGIDSYHPSSLNFVVQTETGLQNPGITDNIVKVTKGHENGFLNRDYIKIQAVGVGKCRVVCGCFFTIPLQQTKGIANVCYNIEVTEAIVKVTSVSLSKSELLLHKGESEVLSASISPANATSKLLEWGTSNDKIATVDSQGKVTAIADGSAIITATALDGSNISSACQLQVITPVTSIVLSKSSVMLKVDQECKLDAIILPTNATNKKVQWISSNPNVATVDNEGNVKGLNVGSCVVVATSSDGTNVHETCYVTVQNKEFVSQIVLDKDEVALLEGEEKRLAAVVLPSTADNKSLVWRSDNEKVATVDEDGLVHALSKGIAIISASSLDGSGVTSSCRVSVLRPVSEILLDRDSLVLSEGDTVRISAVVLPSTADNRSLVWRSDNEEVVTVDEDGLVHALSKGIAIISASSLDGSGVTSSCRVSVLRPVSEILLDRDSLVLSEGDTVRISAVVLPSTADNRSLVWRSDNEEVVTVDEDGLVHALSKGIAIISALSLDGSGVTSSCRVSVLRPVSEILLDRDSLVLSEGDTVRISAVVLPCTADNRSLVWLSDNEEVVTVDEDGLVHALSKGIAIISASSLDGSGVTSSCRVSVLRPVSEILLDRDSLVLSEGDTVRISTVVLPSTADNRSLVWRSDNEEIVTVDEDGLVHALSKGIAIITASSLDGSGVTSSCRVSVLRPVSEILLDRDSLVLSEGDTERISAVVLPSTADNKSLVWRSDNEEVVTIDEDGLVHALSKGIAIITVSSLDGSGVTSSCRISVLRPVSEILLDRDSLVLSEGDTVRISAVVLPSTADNRSLVWRSDNEEVVTVDEDGLVHALSKGIAIITVSSLDGSGVTSSCRISVLRPVSEILLDRDSLVLSEGDTVRISAVVLPSTADNKSLVWRSDNEEVVTVDEDGLVHALSKGFAIISASSLDGSGVTSSCRVSVLRPVSEILLDRDSLVLSEGDTVRISAVVLPSTADNKSLVWRSDNENVATVDEDGLVHAVYEGNTTIFVIAMDGSEVMSKCEIGVLPVSSVKRIAKDRVRVYVANRKVHLENIPSGVLVRIIRPNGSEVFRMRSKMSCVSYQPHTNGLYFVMIDSLLYKVLVP